MSIAEKLMVHQADEVLIFGTISTQWDVDGMSWTKLADEAKQRGRPIIYYAIRNELDNFRLMKFHMCPNGKTFSCSGGIWGSTTMYIEYGTLTRRFLNYWLAYGYQLRLKQAHGRAA